MKSILFGAFALTLSVPVHAIFVNQVETFDGTMKDTTVWQEHVSGPGAVISQNGSLTLSGWCEYQSRQTLVRKGDTVRIQIVGATVSQTHDQRFSGFVLTDFSSGTYLDTGFKLGIEHFFSLEYNNAIFALYRDSNGFLGGKNMLLGGYSLAEHPMPLTLEVTCGLDNVVSYSAYDSAYNLLCSLQHAETSIPDQMYLRLFNDNYNTTTTFDNLQIIPEPCPLVLLVLGGLLRKPAARYTSPRPGAAKKAAL